jgi:hypothetical protein
MLPDDLRRLVVIPAGLVIRDEEQIPERPGVYMFFFRGGNRLLDASSYFDFARLRPLGFRRRQHLYTGAAHNLRRRLKQHMTFIAASSLRRSLLALEHEAQAISRSKTPECGVIGEQSLTTWMCRNALIGIEIARNPLERERFLLSRYASPLNLTLRRHQPYARALTQMRLAAFPAWDDGCVERLRGK